MKKIIASIAALFMVAFAGSAYAQCANQYGSGSPVNTGFGVPWNTQTGGQELTVSVSCTTNNTTYTIGSGNANQIVWKHGAQYVNGAWQSFDYTGSQSILGPDWLTSSGTYSTGAAFSARTPVVGYVCQYVNGAWKCGCTDAACATNLWQLQAGIVSTSNQTGDCNVDPNPTIPQPTPIANVKSYGAAGNGTTDDTNAIKNAIAAISAARQGTLYFPVGTYRVAQQRDPAPIYFVGISNVTVYFEPNTTLLMDNLNGDGSGGGHGISFKNAASNIWLYNVRVSWKNMPSSRSYGDGIRFDGGPTDAMAISNIHLYHTFVEKAPQAGIIPMGVSDFTAYDTLVQNTLADAFHINASRRVKIDGYTNYAAGDDGFPFVTYYDCCDIHTYHGSTEGPYTRPALDDFSDAHSCATNFNVDGQKSAADAQRLDGVLDLHETKGHLNNKNEAGIIIDATEAGGIYGWTVQASQQILLEDIELSNNNGLGLNVVHQWSYGGDGFASDPRFWQMGVQMNRLTMNNNGGGAGQIRWVSGVHINGITGNNTNVSLDNCRDCSSTP